MNRNHAPAKKFIHAKCEIGRDGTKPLTKCHNCGTDLESRISPNNFSYVWCWKCGFTQIK